jgi:protein O-mannosyl-transferase
MSRPAGMAITAGSRRAIVAAAVALVLAVIAAYYDSFSGAFFFDDEFSIQANTTIRHLWPLSAVLNPPAGHGETVGGRPLVNLSLAVNYAMGGLSVASYHAFNLAVHALAALTLFGLVRRTLPRIKRRVDANVATTSPATVFAPAQATWLAFTIALLWALHPLQTESVTYIVQRAESLMGLFYLLTLYAFVRALECHPLGDTFGGEEAAAKRWFVVAVAACAAGMACKEVMVSAPLIVLLYDRTFIAGTFREAWRRRGRIHLALASTWLLLGWLVLRTGNRGGSAAVQAAMTSSTYLLTQLQAITRYLSLSFWPGMLTFDYGNATVHDVSGVVPELLLIGALMAITAVSLWRWPTLGFLGAWFFALLAPSSSFVPIVTQTIAEHRMYLALVAPLTLAVVTIQRFVSRRMLAPGLVAAAALGVVTMQRNALYASPLALWRDTVTKHPENPRAHENVAAVCFNLGRLDEAEAHDNAVLRLEPNSPEAHDNLATGLVALGRAGEALPHFEAALKARPDYATAHYNFAATLAQLGRLPEAVTHYEAALRLDPNFAPAHDNVGRILAALGRPEEAEAHFRAALRSAPDFFPAYGDLARLLTLAHRPAEAVEYYETLLRFQPANADAHFNLAAIFTGLHRDTEAAEHYSVVVRLRPNDAAGHLALGETLLRLGRRAEAKPHLERALQLRPGDSAVEAALRRL